MERVRTTYEVDERGVARLTLNRPEKLNAFDAPMRAEIAATIDEVNADPKVKILVIAARGSYFGAGLDVKEFGQMTSQGEPGQSAWPRPAGDVDIKATEIRKITIAAINGPAVGMSADVALSCDFRIMAESGTIWQAYARLMPPSGGTWLLPRMVGLPRAYQMILLGDPIDARTCHEWGLAYKVVPDSELEPAVETLVDKILEYSPAIMQFTKASIYGGLTKDFKNAMEYIAWTRYVAENLGIAKEAARAIAEKRPPNYPA